MRCVRDTASVCTSCTTGLHVASLLRRSARRIRPMRSRSMTMWIDGCENGSQTRAIFTRHPKRELHEVHYAKGVEDLGPLFDRGGDEVGGDQLCHGTLPPCWCCECQVPGTQNGKNRLNRD